MGDEKDQPAMSCSPSSFCHCLCVSKISSVIAGWLHSQAAPEHCPAIVGCTEIDTDPDAARFTGAFVCYIPTCSGKLRLSYISFWPVGSGNSDMTDSKEQPSAGPELLSEEHKRAEDSSRRQVALLSAIIRIFRETMPSRSGGGGPGAGARHQRLPGASGQEGARVPG